MVAACVGFTLARAHLARAVMVNKLSGADLADKKKATMEVTKPSAPAAIPAHQYGRRGLSKVIEQSTNDISQSNSATSIPLAFLLASCRAASKCCTSRFACT